MIWWNVSGETVLQSLTLMLYSFPVAQLEATDRTCALGP